MRITLKAALAAALASYGLLAGAAEAPLCPANPDEAAIMNQVSGARLLADHGALHRFFDTSPISPSGRYLAITRMVNENRSVAAGDRADIVLVDLKTGGERKVAETRGYELQLGSQLQWGASDGELFFNDVDPVTWKGFAVLLDPRSGKRRRIDGPLFMVAPDGKRFAGHKVETARLAQIGYGVIVPDATVARKQGLDVPEHGVYVTEVASGKSRVIATPRQLVEAAGFDIASPDEHEFYVFQTKWNPQGTRLMVSFQWHQAGQPRQRAALTLKPDGSDIHVAISPAQWARGGHHINWMPDGERISMNLNIDDEPGIELISVRYDGSDMQTVFDPGSGHPSMHPHGLPLMVTDAYPGEPVTKGNGLVPIRLIDTVNRSEQQVAEIYVSPAGGEFRVDPHPAWDPSGRYVVINGFVGCTRNVWLVDLSRQVAQARRRAKTLPSSSRK